MIRPGSLGVSFSPTNDEQTQDAVRSPLQKAIQILSLRVPRVSGARQPVPQSILAGSPTARAGGPSVDFGKAVVESVLRNLMGGRVPAGAAGLITGTGEAPQLAQQLASYAPGVTQPASVGAMQRAPVFTPPPPVFTPGFTPPTPTFTPGAGPKTSVEPPLPRYPGSVPRVPQSGGVIPGPQGPATLDQIERRFVPQPAPQPEPVQVGGNMYEPVQVGGNMYNDPYWGPILGNPNPPKLPPMRGSVRPPGPEMTTSPRPPGPEMTTSPPVLPKITAPPRPPGPEMTTNRADLSRIFGR